MELVVYEKNLVDEVTGFKVYLEGEQVGTLEYRSHEWIAATFEGRSIITLRTKHLTDAVGWLELMIENKKRE